MKIAVCVKEVPGANVPRRHDEATKRLVRDGDQVLNSYDAHAMEAALQLKEAGGDAADATITAICMGPEGASRTLQKALALGADDAVLVTDPALEGSDILATARALAAAIVKQGPFDLVLLGQQASDSDCWVLPGVIAELLEAPVATQASKLELSGGAASLERQTELGVDAGTVGTSGSGTTVVAFTPPPAKAGGVKIEDDGSGADKIVEFLAGRNLV